MDGPSNVLLFTLNRWRDVKCSGRLRASELSASKMHFTARMRLLQEEGLRLACLMRMTNSPSSISEGQGIRSQLNDSSYHWIVRSETLAKYLRSLMKRANFESDWSGRADLNRGPPAPKAGALPGCATPRLYSFTDSKSLPQTRPPMGLEPMIRRILRDRVAIPRLPAKGA